MRTKQSLINIAVNLAGQAMNFSAGNYQQISTCQNASGGVSGN